MIQLRDYQSASIDMLRARWRDRPVLMLPTGGGKTVVASALIEKAVEKGKRVLFLVHRRELVLQAVTRLADFGIEAGVIAAGWKADQSKMVQVASIQTLVRRDRPPADVVIVDECQHARSDTWQELLDHYAPPDETGAACIVGLSATPYRLDGRGLGRVFGCIVAPVTVRELCEQGVLIPPRVLAPPGPDMTGVRKIAGEYDMPEVEKRMQNLTGNVVEHWLRHARPAGLNRPMRTVAFAVSIAHSERLVERFQSAGVRAAHLDGTAGAAERDTVLRRLRAGELDIVSNCMVLGEGWDLPALQCAILARPTASLALHRQQIGRIMRSAPDKDGALVLDHAGNTHRHGLVTSEVDVSLDDRKKAALVEQPIKTCPECFCVMPANAQVCPECGHEFEVEKRDRTKEDDQELIEVQTVAPADREGFYRALVTEASITGRRLGWARYRFRDLCGSWPPGVIGKKKAEEIERAYECSGYEAKASEWGERCGRCYLVRAAHVMEMHP